MATAKEKAELDAKTKAKADVQAKKDQRAKDLNRPLTDAELKDIDAQGGLGDELGIVNRQGSVNGDAAVTDVNADGKVTQAVDLATGQPSAGTTGSIAAGLDQTTKVKDPQSGLVPTAEELAVQQAKKIGALEVRIEKLEKLLGTIHGEHAHMKGSYDKILGRLKNADTLHGSIDNLGKDLS